MVAARSARQLQRWKRPFILKKTIKPLLSHYVK
ncbi:hypothetical protein ACNKHP_13230 [Shigella boydii]